nr:hypothetical protein CFP56_04101 [Quercus suber]
MGGPRGCTNVHGDRELLRVGSVARAIRPVRLAFRRREYSAVDGVGVRDGQGEFVRESGTGAGWRGGRHGRVRHRWRRGGERQTQEEQHANWNGESGREWGARMDGRDGRVDGLLERRADAAIMKSDLISTVFMSTCNA